jgi:DNA-binding transcriptional ArsR family regulator
MQRNWELVRDILLALEGRDTTHGGLGPEQISSYPPEVVSYHLYILNEAGLVEANCIKSSNAPIHCFGLNLTWAGHEFLDSIRNETTWNKIKETVKSKGVDLSFEAIKQVAIAVIKGLLGA